jgi:hypothetical protein
MVLQILALNLAGDGRDRTGRRRARSHWQATGAIALAGDGKAKRPKPKPHGYLGDSGVL